MSVARCTAAGNQVHLAEVNPHIKNLRTGEITKLRKGGNVFVIDFWVKVPSPPTVRPAGAVHDAGGDVRMAPGFTRPGR